MAQCANCGERLENPRAKYCGDRCRMAFGRRRAEQQPEQNADPNTVQPEQMGDSVRVEPEQPGQNVRVSPPPEQTIPGYGGPDCQCLHCQQRRRSGSRLVINHGPWLSADQLPPGVVNRQSLPGDPDYVGVCAVA